MDFSVPNSMFKFKESGLRKLALFFIGVIQKRTLEGKDADGKPFKGYSTKPFAMPSGAITKRAVKSMVSAEEANYTNHNGKLWIVVRGGYKVAKKRIMENSPGYDGTVNLTLSGRMLKALTPVTVNSKGEIVIGFTREEDAQKAIWNEESGRKFLGLSQEDLNAQEIEQIIFESLLF